MQDILLATIQQGITYDSKQALLVSGWDDLLNDLMSEEQRRFLCFTVALDRHTGMWHIHAQLTGVAPQYGPYRKLAPDPEDDAGSHEQATDGSAS